MTKISVVMSVYNSEKYLMEAVDSILNQTFTDFEFIIVDDGSTDKTLSILQTYTDSRIKIISRENKGVVYSRNEAIDIAEGQYIAIMDADDISLPERFSKQVAFLDNNDDYVMVGGNIRYIKDDKLYSTTNYITNGDCIATNLLFSPSFAHPVIMMRNVGQKYEEGFSCEDYRLYTKSIKKGKMTNLSDILLNYRIVENSLSHSKDKIGKLYSDYNQVIYDYMDSLNVKHHNNKSLYTDKNFLAKENIFWKSILENNHQLKNKYFFICLGLYLGELFYSKKNRVYAPVYILTISYIPVHIRLCVSAIISIRIVNKIFDKLVRYKKSK